MDFKDGSWKHIPVIGNEYVFISKHHRNFSKFSKYSDQPNEKISECQRILLYHWESLIFKVYKCWGFRLTFTFYHCECEFISCLIKNHNVMRFKKAAKKEFLSLVFLYKSIQWKWKVLAWRQHFWKRGSYISFKWNLPGLSDNIFSSVFNGS